MGTVVALESVTIPQVLIIGAYPSILPCDTSEVNGGSESTELYTFLRTLWKAE